MSGRWGFFVGIVALGMGAAAAPAAAQRLATSETVWPSPPEQARIRYVGSLGSEADLGRRESFLSRLKRALIGGKGPASRAIQRPFDVHVEGSTRFYVTDGNAPLVILLDAAGKRGAALGMRVPGGLLKPMGLGGDGTGNVYVTDPGHRRVVVLDTTGSYLRTFGGTGTLLNPVDVAVDRAAGRFYVVDSHLHQVVVFDARGAVVGRIGRDVGDLRAKGLRNATAPGGAGEQTGRESEPRDLAENRGDGPGEFRFPGFAAVGPDGTLYVTDQLNFRVQAFDRAGKFLRQIGQAGDGPGTFARPKGIAVDSHGNVYVADAAFSNVQVFDADGRLLLAFASMGHGAGELWMPLGMSVDRRDRIYVADRYNDRAQIYELLTKTGDRSVTDVRAGAPTPSNRRD